MLIRVSGYNSGVKEYLEEGVKNGRDYSREELDERVILDGDLNLTDKIYKSIPDRGQNRYTTFTLSFREDEIPAHILQSITKEFRDFMMYAYEDEEYNFYAEAHIPKIKEVYDKRTGEKIERKPHIHIVVPKINLLSGNVNDVIGDHDSTERYLEAFQEYINQKYSLASPREHVRVNPYNSADVLSRYKGDDFRGKNREFKQGLVKEIIDSDIRTRQDFYSAVSRYGETRVRNQGRSDEYIAVKLPGDSKFTNLKETIFNDNFLVDRKLAKPPLAKHVIADRLHEWPMRAKEIKYVAKANKAFRKDYYGHSDFNEKIKILADEQLRFYEKFGGQNELHPSQRSGSHERSIAETGKRQHARLADSLQSMPRGVVATDRETRVTVGAVFLPGNACVYVEQHEPGGNNRLRSDLHFGGTSGAEAAGEGTEADREGREESPERTGKEREGNEGYSEGEPQDRTRTEGGTSEARAGTETTRTEGGESSGAGREGRESSYQRGEKESEGDTSNTKSTGYPNDTGSVESSRYTGIPELVARDSSFEVRGESGNGQLGIPVYARSPLKVADVSAIERNSRRLFSDSTSASNRKRTTQVSLIKRLMPKAPKNASYVAACLQRRQEQNVLSSPQRSAIYQADKKYYETRRAIISDKRLSNKDKNQFLSVLAFERLKTHLLIKQPKGNNQHEDYEMGSENIRSTIKPEIKYRNTVSGVEDVEQGPQDAKERFRKLNEQIERNLGERSLREKVRIITAADLYTRKSKLSDNVHYLDNTSHKTLFIDTGKTIAVSKHGLHESSVAVALELAKEKFGSTLTVKGTEAFKNTAIEVVAQKGLDIHFTDKEMNRRLLERKNELAIEREGQSLSAQALPTADAEVQRVLSNPEMRRLYMSDEQKQREWNATPEEHESVQAEISGEIEARIRERIANQPGTGRAEAESPLTVIDAEVQRVLSSPEMRRLYMNDQQKQREWNATPEEYEAVRAEISGEIEARIRGRLKEQPVSNQPETAAAAAATPVRIRHEGVLLEHGSAPYNFKPDMTKPEGERDDSYYVRLRTENGNEKVVWGVNLERAVEGLELGERVSLTNMGKETVKWEQQLANGQTELRSGERVAWQGRSLDREVDTDEMQQYQAYEEYHSVESDGPSVA